MKKLQLAIVTIFVFSLQIKAQVVDSVQSYVWECIDVMQKESLFSQTVDWKMVRDSVKHQLATASSMKDAEASVIYAFKQLKDHHGMYGGIDTFYRYTKSGPERKMSKSILGEYQKPRSARTAMLAKNIAYYKMPAVLIGSNTQKMKEWANLLSDSLCKIASQNPKAFIIDLRMNNGGNSEPMWHTLKNLIGENKRTYYVDANGKVLEDETDSATLQYKKAGMPDKSCTFKKDIPVAVLIGAGTASSGEIMALSFTTRKNTKLFGEPTIGVMNSTKGFQIQNKGYLLLSSAYMANAKKKAITKMYIEPDVVVSNDGDDFVNLEKDATVQAALQWLEKKIK